MMPQTKVFQAAQIAASAETRVTDRPKKATGQAEPTPRLPWTIEEITIDGWDCCSIRDADNNHVFTVGYGYRDGIPPRARAELICRAVNHHEELLQALKLAEDGIDEVWADCHSAHMKFIADAIANAEKGNANEKTT